MSRASLRTPSSILDGNSFDGQLVDGLGVTSRDLIERRQRTLGPAYRLFYSEPVHMVRAEGVFMYDAAGKEYLDAYNNVASVGHCNPRVVRAVTEQMETLNTHTRYLTDGVVNFADQLLATMPTELDQVMFTCTGSEANDLAIRVARQYTGGDGVVVTAEAYHGTSSLVAGVSPATGSGAPLWPEVRTVAPPDAYRLGLTSADPLDAAAIAARFAADVDRAFEDLRRHGSTPAALLIDSIFSSDGVFTDPIGLLAPALEVAHRHGALLIADEVQPGFARTGTTFWGFQRHGVVPDVVTMGKPMGNGIPVAAMAVRSELLEPFGAEVPYFNTFGGNPASIAAAQAVLDEIQERDLQRASATLGARFRAGLEELARRHQLIGDVRGAGLYAGVELVRDPSTGDPAGVAAGLVVNHLRQQGVLVSVCGPTNSTLKIRPLLISENIHIDRIVESLDVALTAVQEVAA